MRQIMFLKSKKTIVLEIMNFLWVLINYKCIIRNDKESNIQFYGVVRVKTMFKFIKINKIHANIIDSKFTFRK